MDLTQKRLSTGNRINSAIDNPSSYYMAQSLNNRVNDLSTLLDSMGQAVSTIKVATTTLDAGLVFLEQAEAIAEQAMTGVILGVENNNAGVGTREAVATSRNIDELKADNYEIISSDMKAEQIEALLIDGAKVALSGDITLDRGIIISASNVTIDGNGYTINYSASTVGESVIKVDGAGNTADIKNININANGDYIYGISATNGGKITLDNTNGIKVMGANSQKIWFRDDNLYDGKANTVAILSEQKDDALAAMACDQFYVDGAEDTFGQGTWYLPSIGELMEMCGYDTTKITGGTGTTGYIGDNLGNINMTLSTLASKGVNAEVLSGYLWSSSESTAGYSWRIKTDTGARVSFNKSRELGVRGFQLVENCFNTQTLSVDENKVPKVGDIMYADKSWGSVANYKNDGSMVAVGVITEVLEDGSVKIVSLKNITETTWSNVSEDVTRLKNYEGATMLNTFKSSGDINISFVPSIISVNNDYKENFSGFAEQYNVIISQYNNLMNDGSYKGINLLKGENLVVIFNEKSSSKLIISGKNMNSNNLGIVNADWKNIDDVAFSIKQLKNAINSLRSFVSELGNNYSIVQNREEFTEKLINILTEGADKLTLADMNEEAANMLALQTRQQLAINSLSLASMASQSILKLF